MRRRSGVSTGSFDMYLIVPPPFKCEAAEYIEWEPDPRHAEIMVAALGLDSGSKAMSTSGVKRTAGADETPLDSKGRELYRSCVYELSMLYVVLLWMFGHTHPERL